MAAFAALIVAITLIAQTISAPQGNMIGVTIKTPANLSYDELLYITKVRSGETSQKPITLSPCARAILGCCRGQKINGACSESLNCGAFFFDDNPCSDRFVKEALNAARAFYQQLKTEE